MNFKHTPRIFKDGGKGEKKASRKERKYQKRSDAFNSALQNIENLRASGASASEIGVAQGNLGRLQNRLGADGLNRLREEQRTQAIARDVANTQAREAVQASRGSFGSYQSPQVSVVMPTRTAQIAPVPQQAPQPTPQTNLANQFKTRGEAFNYARKQGWKTFTYDDGKGKYKQFTTEVAPASGTAKQQGQQSQNPQTETQEQGQSTNKNKQFIYLGNRGEPLLNRKFTYSIPNLPILTNDLNLYRSFEGYIPGPNAETDISNQKIENEIPNLKIDSIKDVSSIPIVNSGNSAAKQQGQQSQNPQTETQEQGQSTNKNKQFIYLGNRGEPLLNRKFTYSIPNLPILTNDLNLYRSFEGYIPGPNAETDISNQKIENEIPNLKIDSIKDVSSIPIVNSGNSAASTSEPIVNSGNSAASTSEPKQYLTIGNYPSFFNKKLITSNRFLNQGLVSPSIFFKQGGTIAKHQWGGIAEIAERIGRYARNRQPVVTTDTIAPPNNYGIPMVLTQKTYPPNLFRKNIKQTTEFSRGSGDGDSYGRGHYPVSTTYTGYYNPNDSSLIKQNVGNPAQVNRMNERMRQAGRTTLSGGYYQQGGAIEDLRINDEMKLEALFRYFQAKGVPQETLIDPETGSFNADYEPDATKFFQTVGEDTAFWSAYKSAPDKTIAEYVNNENPESVEMAQKGAKLKQLKKYKKGKSIRKCSCGCNMVTSREKGGKIVSKCSCGCKN